MKKVALFISMLVLCIKVYGQEYNINKNINYYPDSVKKGNSYLNDQCTLDIYYPKNVKGFSTLIWFHGGGLTEGQKEIPEALKNKGFAVIGVGYRLSPKVKTPAYIEDAAAAVAWAFENIAAYGGNAEHIFISGHSAGGYLGLMITLDKSYLSKYNIDANRIAGLIPFSGQAITHFTVRQERGIKNTQAVIDNYAPIFFVRADTPPILLITGDPELELLGRYEENAYLLRMFKLVGNKQVRLLKLEGYDHGGMAQPAFPLLVKEIRTVTDSLKRSGH